MVKPYEPVLHVFNLVQFSANGLGFPFRNRNIGLNGPVILISGLDYRSIGGHASVRQSITEDIAFGERLKQTEFLSNYSWGIKTSHIGCMAADSRI